MTVSVSDRQAKNVTSPTATLAKLLDPIPVGEFWQEYWERKPLVLHRNEPRYYSDLLTLDDIDQVIALTGVTLDNVRVVVNGKETPVSELSSGPGRHTITNSREALYERYRNGSTVVVNSLQDRWRPLQKHARSLGREMDARIHNNIYLTPPGSQGFAPHYDTHDVFVAQIYGSKVWRLAGAPLELPLRTMPHKKAQPDPEPTQEFELCPGDLLYLPRGTIHSATTNETASLHITMGISSMLLADSLQDAIAQILREDVRFRRALPLGFARDPGARDRTEAAFGELLSALSRALSPADITSDAVTQLASINPPDLRGHLLDLDSLPRMAVDTQVRRRTDTSWQLTVDDTVAALHFNNKSVRFPAEVADEVRYVAEHGGERFTMEAIPGELDEPGRRTLVHTLVHEGFLTFR